MQRASCPPSIIIQGNKLTGGSNERFSQKGIKRIFTLFSPRHFLLLGSHDNGRRGLALGRLHLISQVVQDFLLTSVLRPLESGRFQRLERRLGEALELLDLSRYSERRLSNGLS